MIALRLCRIVLHLFRGLFTCAVLFPFCSPAGRIRHIQRWSAALLRICGVTWQASQTAAPLPDKALIVANHVSWLDIFVVNAMQPCRFVAKSDIRGWPLIGWLCAATGTIFIARGKPSDVRRIYKGLVASIHDGERVAFFPEGTTASQGAVLPFHANLFQAAIDAEVPVQPYAVRYLDRDGKLANAADFIGDTTFVQSMVTILKAGGMHAELMLLPAIDTAGRHRRELAEEVREVIVDKLGQAERPFAAAHDTAACR